LGNIINNGNALRGRNTAERFYQKRLNDSILAAMQPPRRLEFDGRHIFYNKPNKIGTLASVAPPLTSSLNNNVCKYANSSYLFMSKTSS
jgi:hypothetical protein